MILKFSFAKFIFFLFLSVLNFIFFPSLGQSKTEKPQNKNVNRSQKAAIRISQSAHIGNSQTNSSRYYQIKAKALLDSCRLMDDHDRKGELLDNAGVGYRLAIKLKNDSLGAAFAVFLGDGWQLASKFDSAIKYFKLSQYHALKTKNEDLIILSQKGIINNYEAKGASDSVYSYLHVVESNLSKVKSDKIKGQITSMLGATYTAHNNYEKAINYYLTNIRYNNKIRNETGIGMALTNIGNCYLQMSNNKKALIYFFEAIPHLNAYARAQIICYQNIGVTFINENNADSAIKYFNKSLLLAKHKNDSLNYFAAAGKLGLAQIAKKNYNEAGKLLYSSLEYALRTKDIVAITDGYTFLGNLAHAQKQYGLAEVQFKKALKYAIQSNHAERENEIYRVLAENQAAAKKFADAYLYEFKFNASSDSLAKESTKSSITELESTYQSERKQQQINILVHQKKEKEIEVEIQTRTKYFLIAGLILVLIIVGLTIRAYSIEQKAKKLSDSKNEELQIKNIQLKSLNDKLDEANKSKSKLFSILSHDLRAPINSVFQFVKLQKSFTDKLNDEEKQKHSEHIMLSAENLMSTMEDLLIWSKSQMDSFTLNPSEENICYLIEDTYTLLKNFADEKNISLISECPENFIIEIDLNLIKIVLRNIVSNGIKFTSPGGKINILTKKIDNTAIIEIKDNGLGMNEHQIKNVFEWSSIRSDSSGLGLKLAHEFTSRLKGEINVHSTVNQGTTFILTLPLFCTKMD